MTKGRFEGLTDLQWLMIAPLLPADPVQRGKGHPLLVDENGSPLALISTAANGDERQQVEPLDKICTRMESGACNFLVAEKI